MNCLPLKLGTVKIAALHFYIRMDRKSESEIYLDGFLL